MYRNIKTAIQSRRWRSWPCPLNDPVFQVRWKHILHTPLSDWLGNMNRVSHRYAYRLLTLGLVCVLLTLTHDTANASSARRSAIVQAVAKAKPAIVSINGQKTVRNSGDSGSSRRDEGTRRVNGMGTGVIVDERGYIVTNHHVVEGVKEINVTLADKRSFIAELVEHDPNTDLALIKIPTTANLPLIEMGTSSDLMQGERVIAIGNAFGYEHSVTCGFISALHRSVEVTETQDYDDLIQTDASINPGNSGGPLVNIDGEMIGINVAVHVGAQGIGFAIPVDKVIEVSARMVSARHRDAIWHGIAGYASGNDGESSFVISRVSSGSPAEQSGIRAGDRLKSVDHRSIFNELDLERSLLGRSAKATIPIVLERNHESLEVAMVLESANVASGSKTDELWQSLGMKVSTVRESVLRANGSQYSGGLQVTALRSNGPAAAQGIKTGDILVGMHQWETVSVDNVRYVLNRPEIRKSGRVKFYVVRGDETLYGHLNVLRASVLTAKSASYR